MNAEVLSIDLQDAVGAFQELLQGKNFGKLLVRVSADPTR